VTLSTTFPHFSNVPAAMHVAPFPFHLALIIYYCIKLQEDWRENFKKEVQLDLQPFKECSRKRLVI